MGFTTPTFLFLFTILTISHPSLAQFQCGVDAGGKLCDGGLCCSQYGYCGSTTDYCVTGCQSQCSTSSSSTTTGSGSGVGSIVTSSIFDQFFNHRSDANCPANGFYTYDAFLQATAAYSSFGTSGDSNAQKRELAAFFANTAHEVTGGCYKEEIDQSSDYCSASAEWPCASGKKYYGRGPIQISWNYNYGQAGQALDFDGINNPDIVASDPTISFKTALWFWMTAQSPKPSCHDAIVNGQGFGQTINIINGGIECGSGGNTAAQQSRITLYQQYCQILAVDPGSNLTC